MNGILRKITGNTLNVAIVSLGRLLILALLARALSKENYGMYAWLLWWAELFVLLVGFGLPNEFMRFIPELKNGNGLRGYISIRFIKLSVLMLAGIACVLLAAFNQLILLDIPRDTLILFVLYLIGFVYTTAAKGVLRGFELYARTNRVELFTALFVIAGIAIWSERIGINLILSLYIAAYTAVVLWFLLRSGGWRDIHFPTRDTLGSYNRYSFYVWINGLLSFLLWSRAELFFVEKFGMAAVAEYSVAITIAGLLFQFCSMFLGVLLPHFVGSGTAAQAQYTLFFKYFGLLLFAAAAVAAPFVKFITALLFGATYQSSYPYTAILLFGALSMISGTTNAYLLYKNHSSYVLIANIGGGVVLIAGSLAAVYLGEPMLIALTKALSQWAAALMLIFKTSGLAGEYDNGSIKRIALWLMALECAIYSQTIYGNLQSCAAVSLLALGCVAWLCLRTDLLLNREERELVIGRLRGIGSGKWI